MPVEELTLAHPSYERGKDSEFEAFERFCGREEHETEAARKGHIISQSALKYIAVKRGRKKYVQSFITGYRNDPEIPTELLTPTVVTEELTVKQATRVPGFCDFCESHHLNIDGFPDPSKKVYATLALQEACGRNTQHALWLLKTFISRSTKFAQPLNLRFIAGIPDDLNELKAENSANLDIAAKSLPPLPSEIIKAGTKLDNDEHFCHLSMIYEDTPCRFVASTEVVLWLGGMPNSRTLGFINVLPHLKGQQTLASLSIPRTADPKWIDMLTASATMEQEQHQQIVSNLAVRSPDGICFNPEYLVTLDWETTIKPRMLANHLPGLLLPDVHVDGEDIKELAQDRFNLFKC